MARKRTRLENATSDLTPMIDVVFLLLIFFVLITEITQADLEEMKLPEAEMAKPDDAPPPGRLVVNVVLNNPLDPNDRNGAIIIKRQRYDINSEELRLFLKAAADEAGRDDKNASNLKILIRVDRNVKFSFFQKIMALFANPKSEILAWQIQIAIAKPLDER